MAEILLLNPRKRKRARRKMSALQRKYFGKRKRSSSAARATNPRRRRRRVAARSYPTVRRRRRANPSRRRAIGYTMGSRRVRRRRLNPSLRTSVGGVPRTAVRLLKSGTVGAVGALGLDMLWGQIMGRLPASVAGSPLAQYALKLLGAVGIGLIGEKVWRGRGTELAVGASTVVIHDALKAQVAASFPGIRLGEYLTYAPTVGTMDQAGRLLSTGMGEYLSGLPNEVGYANDSSGYYGDGNGDYSGDGMSG